MTGLPECWGASGLESYDTLVAVVSLIALAGCVGLGYRPSVDGERSTEVDPEPPVA